MQSDVIEILHVVLCRADYLHFFFRIIYERAELADFVFTHRRAVDVSYLTFDIAGGVFLICGGMPHARRGGRRRNAQCL